MRLNWGLSAGTSFLIVSLSTLAHAQERPLKVETSVRAQYGVLLNAVEGAATPFGFGFGARVGFRFRSKVYAGGVFDYNIGSTTFSRGLDTDVSARSIAFGFEAGFDVVVRALRIRPRLGLGWFDLIREADLPPLVNTVRGTSSFLIFPGISALLDLTDMFFAGVEVTVYIPTEFIEFNEKSLAFGVCLGARF